MCKFIFKVYLFSIALAVSQTAYAANFSKVLSKPVLLTALEKPSNSIQDLAQDIETRAQINGLTDNDNLTYGPVRVGETFAETEKLSKEFLEAPQFVTPTKEDQYDISEIVPVPVVENSVVSATNPLLKSSLENASLTHNIMSNLEYVGGIFGIILIGMIWIVMTSQKKEILISDDSGACSIDFVKNPQLRHKIMDSEVVGTELNTPVPEFHNKSLTAFDLTKISLEMNDAASFVRATDDTFLERSPQWHEVATKIDLARVYKEMDAHGNAKEILLEIINEGDAQQRAHAESMLVNLKDSS